MSMMPKAPSPALPQTLAAARVAAAPVDEVMGWLNSSAQGLSSAEASARRAFYGPNAVRTHHVNALAVLGRQLRSAVLILLAVTAVVSYFLGDSVQAVIIGVILAASIGLGFINEYRAERAAAWMELMDRFGGDVDWSGYEAARANLWHRQLHIFLHPFYYIEYGIAQLGALQVWANSKQDRARTLNEYKQALALGGSRPLPELFAAAGCKFQFDAATIKPLIQLAQKELMKL